VEQATHRAFKSHTTRGRQALATGLVALWLLAPGLRGSLRGAETDARSKATSRIPLIYQKKRSFRIPFHVDEEGRSRLKEVQLWVSEDSGFNWEPKSRTTPDLGKFTFRTNHDGEFWFATRTLTVDNEYSPPMSQTAEPSMRVIVDTLPPSLVLEPDGRRGSMAAVRWEVKDEHLDKKSFVLEYKADGAREWRTVPVRQLSLIGSQGWDAGTADSLRVRATVSDKAGNVADAEIVMPEGTAGSADFAAADPDAMAPPVEQISDVNGGPVVDGQGLPPVEEQEPTGPRRSLAQRPRVEEDRGPAASRPAPDWNRGGAGFDAAPVPGEGANGSPMPPAFANPFPESGSPAGNPSAGPGAEFPAPAPGFGGSPAAGAPATNRTLLVGSPRFKLRYDVQDAGPNGPSSVELWLTQDGGRTWIRRAEDPDRVSPFEVDLGGEGTFGLSLVARSASGLGDQPPAPNDPPQTWVEVDSKPPSVQLYPPQVGTGPHAGKVAITWRASDLHLAPRSVSLLWRPDEPGAGWQPIPNAEGLENMGQFIWNVPPSFPAKFHVRVEAVDTVGHRGGAETGDASPVIVDRSRPRSRIIGLDPSARVGDGPSARPMR
jgi:hypothetical protein